MTASCQHCGHPPHKPGECKLKQAEDGNKPDWVLPRCKCQVAPIPSDGLDKPKRRRVADETVIQETE